MHEPFHNFRAMSGMWARIDRSPRRSSARRPISKYYLACLLILAACSTDGESGASSKSADVEPPNIIWEKTFGGRGNDTPASVTVFPDGGLAVAGGTESKGAGGEDFWILRLDPNGKLLWDRTFGGSGGDRARSVVAHKDGGLVVTGVTGFDAWVLRLDENGTVIWERTFGGSGNDALNSVIILRDGHIVVAGGTNSKGAGDLDAWVLQLDEAGDVIWERTFGGPGFDLATEVIALSNGDLALAAWTGSKGSGQLDFWVLRLDGTGQVVWDRTFGGARFDFLNAVTALRGGGLAVVGTTQSAPGSDDNIARVVRLDAAGTVVWNRTFGANFAAAVTGLPDGGLAVVGFTEPPDVWVLRLDDAGDVVQESTFGGSRDDGAAAVGVLPDGTFVVAGSTESKGAGGSDYWVLRFDRQSLGD